jgi:hypothetical protein
MFNFIEHLDDVRTAHFVNAQFANSRFHETVERTLIFIGRALPQRLFAIAHVSSDKIIENIGDRRRNWWCRAIIKWVLSPVDALTQLASFMYRFERRPIRPRAYREPIFVAAKTIVEDEGPGARGGNANTKTARGLGALDRGPAK